MSKNARVFDCRAEGLNEYAGHIERNEPVPDHTPSYPHYWFDGLARELSNLRDTSWEEKLTPFALALFKETT